MLAIIEDEALQANAARVGALSLALLQQLPHRHEAVGDVRGMGLLMGVELVKASCLPPLPTVAPHCAAPDPRRRARPHPVPRHGARPPCALRRSPAPHILHAFAQDRATKEPDADAAAHVMSYLRTHCGVLVSTDGPGRNVLKMKPPICFSEADAHTLYEAIDEALAAL